MGKLYATNRKRLAKLLPDNSLLILFAGTSPYKRGDEFYPFSPQRNFFYCTGIDSQNVIFTLYKNKDTVDEKIYLERFDEVRAKWIGAPLTKEEAEKVSGIENYGWIDEFEQVIAQTMFSKTPIVFIDLENRSFSAPLTADVLFANKVRERFPALKIENAYPLFAELRVIKSKEEIKNIQKAINITRDGIYQMMRNAKPGMMEYEIEAFFDYTLKKNGVCERAFASIAASGLNATVLHYTRNNGKTGNGDLILFDVGAQYGYYSADITRTFPVNGKFTERQKLFYNIVLEGQKKVIEMIKPGVAFRELNDTLKNHYFKELKRLDMVASKDDVSKYYYHGVSHMLGLETHDIGRGAEGSLKKGMVLTVEPGLYIAEESIGIRIEDDVAVTDDGCVVLSKDIIRTVSEIEALMNEA